ncbi:MAG TPA: metal-dependent hydrolase [Pyrinomonadaceae bacterium]|nr:metal-dependent hydrolase [Pyrinomonadaceae bacterium]
MDNLTHSLVGLAAAKAGLERTSPLATTICVVAANAPDADIVVLFAGPSEYLEHHRGITHSIVGTLALALLLPAIFYGIERLVARFRGAEPRARFGGLLVSSLALSASHPLLDWTNSYGVRPLLPWSAQWFYGDLVFVLDPWIWLFVGGACFLLTANTRPRLLAWATLALVLSAAVLLLPLRAGLGIPFGARVLWVFGIIALVLLHRSKIASRGGVAVASMALALLVAYWGAIALIHARAHQRARVVAGQGAAENGETLLRIAAMPVLSDPTVWRCIAETNRATVRFDLTLGTGQSGTGVSNTVRIEKPQGEDGKLVERAAEDSRAEIFLGFARFPVTSLARSCAGETIVQFADLRFTEPGGGGSFTVEVPAK